MSGLPLFHLTLLYCVLAAGDGRYLQLQALCRTLGSLQNVELLVAITYNKEELASYNSTENKVIGYTEYANKWAKDLNDKIEFVHKEAEKAIEYCKSYGAQAFSVAYKAVKPDVIVKLVKTTDGPHPAVLVCSAYDFYPKPIKVSWLRDGAAVTSDVTYSDELSDGDWYYQIHSHLQYTPRPGEKISSVVEHSSFTQPMTYHWDPSLPASERIKTAVGASGLVLGFISAASGIIYYTRKRSEWISVHGQEPPS